MKKLYGLFVSLIALAVFTGSARASLEVRGIGSIVSGGSGQYNSSMTQG